MNDYQSRFIENALDIYDSRRSLGMSEPRALYSTSAGLAATLSTTREKATRLLVAALDDRAQTPTRTDTGAL